MSLAAAIGAVFRRDLRLAWSGGGAAAPLGFFAGATTLVPLTVGPDLETLARIGPPLLWVTVALAALMILERLFQADLEDGSLDQLHLTDAPLEFIVAAKGAALWVGIGLPLAVTALPAALALQTPPHATLAVAAGLLVGLAAFIGFGLFGAALAAGVRRGGVLIAILVLPFFAPPIIFGAAAAGLAADEGLFTPAFALLCGCALGAVALGPIGAAAALRLQSS
ncbi:MAG: heme exporter protein CcmB [Hyphomonadaceae bacterium]|nr:heme exporter protein CcmB [Hyphomonadaceae bacterium]